MRPFELSHVSPAACLVTRRPRISVEFVDHGVYVTDIQLYVTDPKHQVHHQSPSYGRSVVLAISLDQTQLHGNKFRKKDIIAKY